MWPGETVRWAAPDFFAGRRQPRSGQAIKRCSAEELDLLEPSQGGQEAGRLDDDGGPPRD